MPDFPVTGYMLYDFLLAGVVFFGGFALVMKAGNKWGVIPIAAAVGWGFMLVKGYL